MYKIELIFICHIQIILLNIYPVVNLRYCLSTNISLRRVKKIFYTPHQRPYNLKKKH